MDEHIVRGFSDAFRTIELTDGTVFTIFNKYALMFEDGLFYEVEFGGYEIKPSINPFWNKTGKIYTVEEVNNLNK